MVAIHASILLSIKITKQSNNWMSITSFLSNLDRTWANWPGRKCIDHAALIDKAEILWSWFWSIRLWDCIGNLEINHFYNLYLLTIDRNPLPHVLYQLNGLLTIDCLFLSAEINQKINWSFVEVCAAITSVPVSPIQWAQPVSTVFWEECSPQAHCSKVSTFTFIDRLQILLTANMSVTFPCRWQVHFKQDIGGNLIFDFTWDLSS